MSLLSIFRMGPNIVRLLSFGLLVKDKSTPQLRAPVCPLDLKIQAFGLRGRLA